MTFSNKIDSILNRGINLHDSNIHNWALTRHQALEVLEEFKNIRNAIAGGDVMNEIEGQIGFSGDSWHSDKRAEETDDNFVERSISEAREYIINYPTSDNIYFTIVPW